MSQTYHSHAEINQMHLDLWDAHPQYVKHSVVGKTYLNNDIIIGEIGNPAGGRILFDGCMHGWEDMGSEILYLFQKWLLESNDYYAQKILDENLWLIIPTLNYDGVGRGNMHLCNPACNNSEFGVDINRNFLRGWSYRACCIATTQEACLAAGCNWWNGICCTGYPNNYHGDYAGSEPETQLLRQVMQNYSPDVYINSHYGGGPYFKYYGGHTAVFWTPIRNRILELWKSAGIPTDVTGFKEKYGIGINDYLPTSSGGPTGNGFAVGDAYNFGIEPFLWETYGRTGGFPCKGPPGSNPPYSLLEECIYPLAKWILIGLSEAVGIPPEPVIDDIKPITIIVQ